MNPRYCHVRLVNYFRRLCPVASKALLEDDRVVRFGPQNPFWEDQDLLVPANVEDALLFDFEEDLEEAMEEEMAIQKQQQPPNDMQTPEKRTEGSQNVMTSKTTGGAQIFLEERKKGNGIDPELLKELREEN